MRKLAIVLLFLLAGTVLLYSEEVVEEEAVSNDSEQPVSSVVPTGSQLILYDKFYVVTYPGAFRFSDGSTLSYSRLKENLALVPENGKLIRRADTYNVLYYVFCGATIALGGVALYSAIDETSGPNARTTPGERTMGFVYGEIMAAGFGLFASYRHISNLNKAISNYNLSVVGVPAIYR
jgi:hypothetical protein